MKKVTFTKRSTRLLPAIAAVLALLATLMVASPVLAAPLITLSPSAGAAGTQVTVAGISFESYRGDSLHVFFDNTEVPGSPLVVPDDGTFSFPFHVAADASPGNHTVRVKNEAGSTLALGNFTVPTTGISLNITMGGVGSAVTVRGQGFYSGQAVNIYYYNRVEEKLGTILASAIGDFSYQFTVPAGIAGKHKIKAANTRNNLGEADFEILPAITAGATSGAPGTKVNITGTGFGYKSDVSIQLKGSEITYTNTDQYGSFNIDFHVPDIKAGTYDLRVIDEKNNVDQTRFTVTAGASLSSVMGAVGSELTVTGSGFVPGGTITISYDATMVITLYANTRGEFSGSFSIPISKAGNHVITVTDGTSTRNLNFAVESSPPPVPALLLPSNNTETGAKAYFDWEEVTDPSQPVTYSLQVAADMNFSTVVLDRGSLTASEYTLQQDEVLSATKPDTYYYWRVKAIDGASNESEWSLPWSFYISPPPASAPLLPTPAAKAESLAHFTWEDVSGLSQPITYVLQIASDPAFKNLVLEKTGLTGTEYTLSGDEKLPAVKKDAPYYWRVKSVDDASNESTWSEPVPFQVGLGFSLPGWGLAILVVIGVILIGGITFLFGRRTAYGPRPPYS